jgi:hypothetical protein
VFLPACRTPVPHLPPVNVAEPGWSLRQGQAVWRSDRHAPEIAGEVLVATHPDGRSIVQFIKVPLPLLAARIAANGWQIDFIPENRTLSGQGQPPARLLWLHVARALNGIPPPAPARLEKLAEGGWRLDNAHTGETLTLYLSP